MKKTMIALLAFSFLAGTAVFAQDAAPATTTTTKKAKKHHHKKDKKNASTEAPKPGK